MLAKIAFCFVFLFSLLFLNFYSYPVHAQRAGENAVTSAEDAFGVSIGDDEVGLSRQSSVRRFGISLGSDF